METPWHCSACGMTFISAKGFDAHRTGKYTGDAYPYGRRCLSPEEFTAKGFVQGDDDPRWRKPMSEASRAQLNSARG
jgi:rubredoxin